MSVPVFVTCRDRVECLRLLVRGLERLDDVGRIILIDNDSAWPPMVEYLATTPHEVVRVDHNAGHRVLWDLDIHPELRAQGPFVLTDPDVVPDPGCPSDTLAYLNSVLEGHPGIVKVGLGLRIDDLPAGLARSQEIYEWESQWWESEVEPGLFEVLTDTTFALYRPGAQWSYGPALRTGPPYVGRHLPWYADLDAPDPEEIFYRARSRPDSTTWHSWTLQPDLAAKFARRRRRVHGRPDHPLLDAWTAEPELRDLSELVPGAVPGWSSWNESSPEAEFSELAGALAKILAPALIVETGVGQGFTTRRLDRARRSGVHLCFESDAQLRTALADLPFFVVPEHRLSSEPTPSDEDLARADLTVLDSVTAHRYDELTRWRELGREGSWILVHESGDDRGDAPALQDLIADLDIPGSFLRNPRGGFIGLHPGPVGPNRLRDDLADSVDGLVAARRDLDAAREELQRMRATLSWKVTRPLRAVRAKRFG